MTRHGCFRYRTASQAGDHHGPLLLMAATRVAGHQRARSFPRRRRIPLLRVSVSPRWRAGERESGAARAPETKLANLTTEIRLREGTSAVGEGTPRAGLRP